MRVTTSDLDATADSAAEGGTTIGGASPAAGLRLTGAALAAFYTAVGAGDALFRGDLTNAGTATATGSSSYTHTDTNAAGNVTSSC